ncbi:MAG TPA: hypothetical protein VHB21_20790, partial [Minicystis sp.]|nr:hypothetical protein [Minicystis sp.]
MAQTPEVHVRKKHAASSPGHTSGEVHPPAPLDDEEEAVEAAVDAIALDVALALALDAELPEGDAPPAALVVDGGLPPSAGVQSVPPINVLHAVADAATSAATSPARAMLGSMTRTRGPWRSAAASAP